MAVDIALLGIEVRQKGIAAASAALGRLTGAGKKSEVQANRLNRAYSRANKTLGLFKSTLVAIGLGIGFAQSLAIFSDYEKGLIGIGKTADISGLALDALGKDIQRIARDLPVATTELLGIAQAAGQLGVKGKDNILNFTETVGKLGLASNLAGEEAATALARILTVTGTSIGEVDKLGSVIVRLGNNFAATEAEIAATATRVAQSTSQFDVHVSSVVGIATAMKAIGVQAEAAGSVTGRAFQKINDALRGGGEELKALVEITGQTEGALKESFGKEAEFVFLDFVKGLGRIKAAGGDVSANLKKLGLEGVIVQGVMGTLASRSDVLASSLKQANDEWSQNTALTKEALVAAKSFSAQMTLAKNAIDEAAVELGRELAPIIVDLTRDFREWIAQAKDTGQITDAAESVASAFKLVADNLDWVVTLGSAFIGLRLGAALGPMGAAIGVTAGALLGLKMVMEDSIPLVEKLRTEVEKTGQSFEELANQQIRSSEVMIAHLDSWVATILNAPADLITSFWNLATGGEFVSSRTEQLEQFTQRVRDLKTEMRDFKNGRGMFEDEEAIYDPQSSGADPKPKTPLVYSSSSSSSTTLNEDLEEWKAFIVLQNEVDSILTAVNDNWAEQSAIYSDHLQAMQDGNAVLELEVAGRAVAARYLEEEIRLRSILGRQLLPEEKRQLEEIVKKREHLNKVLKANETESKDAADAARDLGLTFTSAFEDAIVSGAKFSDILKGIEKDLLRLGTRKLLTEPFLNFIDSKFTSGSGGGGGSSGGGFLSGIGSFISTAFGSLFGGGVSSTAGIQATYSAIPSTFVPQFFADGGNPPVGVPSVVGEKGPEWFIPKVAGTIFPNNKIDKRGGSQTTINNFTMTVQTNDADSFNRSRAQIASDYGQMMARANRRNG